MFGTVVLMGIVAAGIVFFGLVGSIRSQKRRVEWLEKAKLESENLLRHKDVKLNSLSDQINNITDKLKKVTTALEEGNILIAEQSVHFPWLADAFADLHDLRFQREEQLLRQKKHPAHVAAEKVAELRAVVRETQRNFRLTKYRIQFYEKLFPWLIEVSGEDITELIADHASPNSDPSLTNYDEQKEEPARQYLSEIEWNALSISQKYQRALDRWKDRKKHNWEIGRDYERYIGYCLERDGYDVIYHGAIEGFADLGRDLIAKKNGEYLIVQCKYWAKSKLVHEKHVLQTFATALEFEIDNNLGETHQGELFDPKLKLTRVLPKLVVSCGLSPRALKAASRLNVIIEEDVPLTDYPLIKCNIAPATGERIYHLPFDQQYDRVKIRKHIGESYVATIEEAEKLGFRRAFRWRPTDA